MVPPYTAIRGAIVGAVVGPVVITAVCLRDAIRCIVFSDEPGIRVETHPVEFVGWLPWGVAAGVFIGFLVGRMCDVAREILYVKRQLRRASAWSASEIVETHASSGAGKHWYQFRLRTCLLLMLLAGIAMSWSGVCVQGVLQEKEARRAILRLGGRLSNDALDLRNTPVTDTDLRWIVHLSGLERLYLSGTAISDAGLSYLRCMTGLKFLSLANTQVTGDGLRHLAKLSKLETLQLDGIRIGQGDLRHLEGLVHLKVLGLTKTGIDDLSLKELPVLPELTELYLCDTEITASSLDHLSRYGNLKVVGLGRTRVGFPQFQILQAERPGLLWIEDAKLEQ